MGMKRGVVLAIAACAVNAWWHGRSFVFGGFRSIATGSRPASAHRRQAGTGAYITLEELDRAPAVRKRRHKKLQEFQEGKWKVVSNEQPLPEPSEDRSTLGIQLEETQKAERLLTFLESAVRSPAFDARLGARALEQLAEQRPSLQDDELSKLSSQPGLVALVVKTEQQLKDGDGPGLGPRWSAMALRGLAVYQDIPVLQRLVVPVAEEAARSVAEMNNRQVAICVWAVAELKEVSRRLQDNLLPLLVQNDRILGVRSYLKKYHPFENSLLKHGLMKLRRDVPYLREFLPMY